MRKILSKIFNKLFPSTSILDLLLSRGLIIGKNFSMQDEVIIDPSHCWHIKIGDDVTLAPRVYILAHDASTKRALGYTKIAKVEIGDRVFVGAGSIILPGVTIGDDVVVGAGSIVSSDIPSNSLVVGSPAKVVDSCSNYLEKRAKEMDKSPIFSAKYTIGQGVSKELQHQMNEKMIDKIGYIV